MAWTLQPWQALLAALAGWINRHQQAAIDFLREDSRVLLQQLGDRRLRAHAHLSCSTNDSDRRMDRSSRHRGSSNVKSVLRNPDLVAVKRRIERRFSFWTIRARHLALAHGIDRRVRAGELDDLAHAARAFGLTRAGVTQIASLTLLPPTIQVEFLAMPPVTVRRDVITERPLRPIVGESVWERQMAMWEQLRKEMT